MNLLILTGILVLVTTVSSSAECPQPDNNPEQYLITYVSGKCWYLLSVLSLGGISNAFIGLTCQPGGEWTWDRDMAPNTGFSNLASPPISSQYDTVKQNELMNVTDGLWYPVPNASANKYPMLCNGPPRTIFGPN